MGKHLLFVARHINKEEINAKRQRRERRNWGGNTHTKSKYYKDG